MLLYQQVQVRDLRPSWLSGGGANTVGVRCYKTICVRVCLLNGGMKFVPLIRAAGCVTAQSLQCPATDCDSDLPAYSCWQAV